MAVMMTGMGNDGAEAMKRLRQGGGRTIAESESTAIVWGMPGELVKNGGAEMVRPLEDIAATIVDMVSRGHAEESLTWTKAMMTKLGLTLNETKTSVKNA
jgi:chemotaxis response regulator CheB